MKLPFLAGQSGRLPAIWAYVQTFSKNRLSALLRFLALATAFMI